MSPVGAHGGNCAIESVAALANSLECHLKTCSDRSANSETIHSIFERYQKTREARVRKFAGAVHFMTRLGTWDDYLKKLVGRYVLPWLNDITIVSKLVKDAVRVDFLPIPSRSKGFSDQTSKIGQATPKKLGRISRRKALIYTVTGTLFCIMVLTSKIWEKLLKIHTFGSTSQITR